MMDLLIITLIAGFFGTFFMTILQNIEIFFTKRKPSYSPAKAFSKVSGVKLDSFSKKRKKVINYAVHFFYGIVWSLVVLFLYYLGINSFIYLSLFYFAIVLIQGWVIIPLLKIGPVFWKWGLRPFLMDAFYHLVLAASTVFIFLELIA